MMLGAFFSTASAVLSAAFIGLFSRPPGIRYMAHIASALLRAMSASGALSSPEDLAKQSTTSVYRNWTKKNKVETNIVRLEHGGEALWMGSPNTKRVLLYFHGGAYVFAAVPTHFDIVADLMKNAKSSGHEFSVLFLAYDLGSAAKYPTQLVQAAGALQTVLKTNGRTPQDILLGGDSAGGNLVLSLLSHLSHPHPQAPKIDLKDEKLKLAFLISSWMAFEYKGPNVKRNAQIDIVTERGLKAASTLFMGGVKDDEYTVPLLADSEWWRDLKVDHLLSLGGDYEMLVDDIVAVAEKMKVHNTNTELFIAKHEVHDQILVDKALGYTAPESQLYLENWLDKHL